MVYDIVRAGSAVLGISMGQYVGDVLAHHVGMNELCIEGSSLAEWRAGLELASESTHLGVSGQLVQLRASTP